MNIQSAIFILTCSLFFVACNPDNQERKSTEGQQKDTISANAHNHSDKMNGLSLNNGAKWKADSSTNSNVENLIRIADSHHPVSLDDYHKAGKALEAGINKLIQGCRMQGPDHDALHHWLEPLLEKNKELLKASSLQDAEEIFKDEKEHLHVYRNFFE